MYVRINRQDNITFGVCRELYKLLQITLKNEILKISKLWRFGKIGVRKGRNVVMIPRLASYAVSSESITIIVFSTPGLDKRQVLKTMTAGDRSKMSNGLSIVFK